MRDADCVAFLQWALPRLGLRWAGFRKVRRQVCRRLARRLAELRLDDLDAYRKALRAIPDEWAALDRLCRVTISRFFRDRGVWRALAAEVLPLLAERALTDGRRRLRAWSAGCASGEEPYSLSILWHRELAHRYPDLSLRIVASDRDPALLLRARRAIYPAGSLREASTLGYDSAFEPIDNEMRVRDEFRPAVDLVVLDLCGEPPNGLFDLLLCRNLPFTYYDAARQLAALRTLRSRLVPGGVLVIGSHERLPAMPDFRDENDRRLARLGIIAHRDMYPSARPD
jgi:chemotaxis protein methyltransferase CheR